MSALPRVGSQQWGCVRSYQAPTWRYLELRGGTHLVVVAGPKERPPEPRTQAPFDLMFDDVDATHRIFAERGLSPSPIRRGRIHNSFELVGPDGWVFTVNSSHASGQPISFPVPCRMGLGWRCTSTAFLPRQGETKLRALDGVYRVFSVQPYSANEIRQGVAVIEVAKRQGVDPEREAPAAVSSPRTDLRMVAVDDIGALGHMHFGHGQGGPNCRTLNLSPSRPLAPTIPSPAPTKRPCRRCRPWSSRTRESCVAWPPGPCSTTSSATRACRTGSTSGKARSAACPAGGPSLKAPRPAVSTSDFRHGRRLVAVPCYRPLLPRNRRLRRAVPSRLIPQ